MTRVRRSARPVLAPLDLVEELRGDLREAPVTGHALGAASHPGSDEERHFAQASFRLGVPSHGGGHGSEAYPERSALRVRHWNVVPQGMYPVLTAVLMSHPKNVLDISPEHDRAAAELSDERFDRGAFALHALAVVRPRRTTVAICEGAARMRIERGRRWGHAGESWAMLAIPPHASRRAIALAVAELSSVPHAWALDVLLELSNESPGE
jgi:hypothetical protein